jgi:hypothetical protein
MDEFQHLRLIIDDQAREVHPLWKTSSTTPRICGGFMGRSRCDKERGPAPPVEQRVLPMPLRIGDRRVEETGLWEVIAWPMLTCLVFGLLVEACW